MIEQYFLEHGRAAEFHSAKVAVEFTYPDDQFAQASAFAQLQSTNRIRGVVPQQKRVYFARAAMLAVLLTIAFAKTWYEHFVFEALVVFFVWMVFEVGFLL